MQPTFIISTGLNGRSAAPSVFIRPVNSLTVNSNYFLPAVMGGDHAFKFGGYWHDANSTSINHTGGYATVRFPTDAASAGNSTCATAAGGCQVDLTRDGYSVYDLTNFSAYVQDTITHGRVDAAARRPLRLQPRHGARGQHRREPAVADRGCRRSTSPAPIRA